MAASKTGIVTIPAKAKIYRDISKALDDQNILGTDMSKVAKREAELAKYLGTTDYTKQLTDAQDLGRLQLALAMAQRGFAAAGAAPKRGESPLGTLSRELFSPLAGDAGTVAAQMMQQKQAMNAAQRQEERQLKLAALQDVQTREAARQALALKLMPDTTKDTLLSTLQTDVTFPVTYEAPNGEEVTEEVVGNLNVSRSKTGDVQQIVTLGEVKTPLGVVIPAGYVVKSFGKTPSEEDKGPFEGLKFVVQRNAEGTGWEFPDPKNPIQLLRKKGFDKPINARTLEEYDLLEGQSMLSYSELPDALKGIVGTGTDTFKDHLVVVDVATGKPIIDDLGKWIEVSRSGNKLYRLGTTKEYVQPGKTRLRPISDFNVTEDGETDAERASAYRLGLLKSNMYQIQVSKLPGEHSAFSARSGLFFDRSAYLAGDFAFKYIPPGTDPNDRSRDVTITNKAVIKSIKDKMDAVANTILKSDYGSANQELKKERLANAVRSVLSVTPATLFGTQAIKDIGVDSNGNVVGYNPGQDAFDPAVVAKNAAANTSILKSNPNANAFDTWQSVPIPDNEKDFNKSWGRMRTATEAFPNAFSNTGQAGTDAYDPELVQGRLDVEKVLLKAPLVFRADPIEHRIRIQEEASKQAAARDKSQQSSAANDAYEMYIQRMEFRQALLDFANAAAESGVQGFFTGRAASVLSRIGLSDWIAGEGKEHWNRLSIASDRFQEGQSRRVGREFGDQKISNYDAQAYQKLVADIRSGKAYNKILIDDGLRRVNRELTGLMSLGGKVGWTERALERAAEAGVDFSALNTQMNWHGYGYYGKSRYPTSRQYTPSLSDAQRNVLRTSGQLKDTMYGGQYTLPDVDYLTDNEPMFTLGQNAVAATKTLRMGPIQLEDHLEKLAAAAKVDIEEMRRRVVRSIIKYNIWRANLK